MRAIDADEFFRNYPELAIEPYINAPTVEPKQGEWITKEHSIEYYCSHCGEKLDQCCENFCCHCGADMRKGSETHD